MAAPSLLFVFIAVTFPALAFGRLGSGDTASDTAPWRIFGEAAAVAPANAEKAQVPQPHASILLTEASLQTLGAPMQENIQVPASQVAVLSMDGTLEKVCERTRQALSAQASAGSGSSLPSGPVYKECMAALAPSRDHEQDSDAVDTLSDCMALVNALVSSKNGGDCREAVGVLQASKKAPAAPVARPAQQTQAPAQAQAQTQPQAAAPQTATPAKAVAAKPQPDAMELVAEAMTAVCTETVRDAEVGIKAEGEAMKLANSVAPICQDKAQKHLGAAAAAQSLTHDWCRQLDGRLTIALETGFFFALAPEEAERQAEESNPYASTTRRKFCGRFVDSLQKQAQNGGLYLGGVSRPVVAQPPMPAAAAPVVAAPVVATPVVAAPVVATPVVAAPVVATPVVAAPQVSLPTLPPAPRVAPPVAKEAPAAPIPAQAQPPSPPQEVPAKVAVAKVQDVPVATIAHSTEQREPQPAPATPASQPTQPGVDMLRLVQALSAQKSWNESCEGLLTRLTSEEGSVTEEYALGDGETPEGTKVLTFNAEDQGQIRKCAAQLKVLAIRAGVLEGPPSKGATKQSLISTGATVDSSMGSFDDAEALMDSPWAADACSDIAHGFLTARLAHPGLDVPEFCPLYARDLQAMRGPKPKGQEAVERTKQDMQQLRKRGAAGSLKRHMAKAQAQTQAAAVPAKLATDAKEPSLRAPAAQVKRAPPAALQLISDTPQVNDEEKEGMDFWRGLLQDVQSR